MPLDQEVEQVKDKEMSFFDHIDVLRKHLLRSAYILIILSILAAVFFDELFHGIVLGPLRSDFITYKMICKLSFLIYKSDEFCIDDIKVSLLNTEIAGQFMMNFKLAFTFGLILSMPYILWQVWLFIKPALSKGETSNTRGFVFYTTFLFICGVGFGYFILCPISINFLSNYTISPLIENKISLSNIISFLTLIVLGCGLLFELPLLMYFLAKLGLISSAFLKKYRKHAFVIILILAAIATPPDVVSQVIMTIPLYSLFELGIIIIKKVERKNTADGQN